MAWCHQATSHYLSQCWHSSPSPNGITRPQWVNSLRPSDTYMRQYNIPPLVKIMACLLFSTKPLSEPMLSYCQLDPEEHISVIFYLKFECFHSWKCMWKCRLLNCGHFVSASMCSILTSDLPGLTGECNVWSHSPVSLFSSARTPEPLVTVTWAHWPYKSITAYTSARKQTRAHFSINKITIHAEGWDCETVRTVKWSG